MFIIFFLYNTPFYATFQVSSSSSSKDRSVLFFTLFIVLFIFVFFLSSALDFDCFSLSIDFLFTGFLKTIFPPSLPLSSPSPTLLSSSVFLVSSACKRERYTFASASDTLDPKTTVGLSSSSSLSSNLDESGFSNFFSIVSGSLYPTFSLNCVFVANAHVYQPSILVLHGSRAVMFLTPFSRLHQDFVVYAMNCLFPAVTTPLLSCL